MARAREYLKRISILMTSLKTRVLRDLFGALQTENCFDSWHMDRLFVSLAMRKKSSNFTSTCASNTRQKRKLRIPPKLMCRFSCSFVS